MAAERHSVGTALNVLAVVLAAVGELEAEKMVSKRGAKMLNANDVVARLQQVGVTVSRADVVDTLRVAITDLGLATGVLSLGEDNVPDARSLHVTMSGVRWLRNEVGRDRLTPTQAESPPQPRETQEPEST